MGSGKQEIRGTGEKGSHGCLHQDVHDGKSTEDAAMQIEVEKSVSSKVIQDLIKARIKEETKKI